MNCITKLDEKTIDDAEDLDLVKRMYNLMEYSSRYSETTGSLWSYSKDEATSFNADITNDNNFKCFMYKANLLENTEAGEVNGVPKYGTTASTLKNLRNFWRSLKMPLINFKVVIKL